jgi:hypothetical protein
MKLQKLLFSLFLLVSGTANAELYKCIDINNKPSFQDHPCAGASKTVAVEKTKSAGPVREYSADWVDVKSGRVTQKVAIMPDKYYSETFDASGKRQSVGIIRLDQRKMYVFSETNKTYMEFPFNEDRFTVENTSLGMIQINEEKKVGEETISGYKTSKFHIKATIMGLPATAYYWMAPEFDPFPLRMDTKGVIHELRNIDTRRPDAALFEIREGYKRDMQAEQMTRRMFQKK